MNRRFLRAIALFTAPLVTACATPQHLNDPSRSVMATDTANLLAPRQIPFETKRVSNIDVSYNLLYSSSDNFTGYRLTLIFRNRGANTETIMPTVALRDADGVAIAPYEFYAFMSEAAALAGTVVPPISPTQQSTYYSVGTIRNTATGTTYNYSGATIPTPSASFATGFAQGMAQGAAIRAANDRKEGLLMMRWANTFWLKSIYTLPPDTAVTGAVFFPSPQLGALPLRLSVGLAGAEADFVTSNSDR